jgi:hypothetical protein
MVGSRAFVPSMFRLSGRRPIFAMNPVAYLQSRLKYRVFCLKPAATPIRSLDLSRHAENEVARYLEWSTLLHRWPKSLSFWGPRMNGIPLLH